MSRDGLGRCHVTLVFALLMTSSGSATADDIGDSLVLIAAASMSFPWCTDSTSSKPPGNGASVNCTVNAAGRLTGWSFSDNSQVLPRLRVLFNPPAALSVVSYQYSGPGQSAANNACPTHVWNVWINDATDSQNVTAALNVASKSYSLTVPRSTSNLVAVSTLTIQFDADATDSTRNCNLKSGEMTMTSMTLYAVRVFDTAWRLKPDEHWCMTAFVSSRLYCTRRQIVMNAVPLDLSLADTSTTFQFFATYYIVPPMTSATPINGATSPSINQRASTVPASTAAGSTPGYSSPRISSIGPATTTPGLSQQTTRSLLTSTAVARDTQTTYPLQSVTAGIISHVTAAGARSTQFVTTMSSARVVAYSTGVTMVTGDTSLLASSPPTATVVMATTTTSSGGILRSAASTSLQNASGLSTGITRSSEAASSTATVAMETSAALTAEITSSNSDAQSSAGSWSSSTSPQTSIASSLSSAATMSSVTSSAGGTLNSTAKIFVIYKISFRIKNKQFEQAMSDASSSAYAAIYGSIFPLLNASYTSAFGSSYVKILLVTFRAGSVVVDNWVQLTEVASSDDQNRTQSTLTDVLKRNGGYDTDHFTMTIDNNFRGIVIDESTANVLVISLATSLFAVVATVVIVLSIVACRRYDLVCRRDRDGAPSYRDSSPPRTSAGSDDSSTERSLPRFGVRLPRAQLINSVWLQNPTLSVFHGDPKWHPSDNSVDDHFTYRQQQFTEPWAASGRLSDDWSSLPVGVTSFVDDSGVRQVTSPPPTTVDGFRLPRLTDTASVSVDCDYFGTPIPTTRLSTAAGRYRPAPSAATAAAGVLRRERRPRGRKRPDGRDDDDDASKTRNAAGANFNFGRRRNGRLAACRTPKDNKRRTASEDATGADFGGLFVPSCRLPPSTHRRQQLLRHDVVAGQMCRLPTESSSFPVPVFASGRRIYADDSSSSSASIDVRNRSTAGGGPEAAAAVSAMTMTSRKMSDDEPFPVAVRSMSSSSSGVPDVTWFTRSTELDAENARSLCSDFVQDNLQTDFASHHNNPPTRKKSRHKTDILHRHR